jgi:hypothetical protein
MSYVFHGIAVPAATESAIERYVQHGAPPSHFLGAVLENDLKEAVNRADLTNLPAIPAIVAYLYNKVPMACWGSRENVNNWLAFRAAEQRASA